MIERRFLVIKTTKDGIEYKKYKCIEGWSKKADGCWLFSKVGAEGIAKRLNKYNAKDGIIHFNTLAVEKIKQGN